MFKLPQDCTHLTHQQGKSQNSPIQPSTVCKLWNSRCSSWIQKRQRNQRSNCQHAMDHRKSEKVPEKHLLLLYWLCQSLWLCRSQQTEKFFKRWEYLTTWPASWEICMQVREQQLEPDMEQQTDSKLEKDYIVNIQHQRCIFSPWLFNLYGEDIKRNARLDEAEAGIKIAGRNISNFRYANDTTLMAEGEEELKNLLLKVKKLVKTQHSKSNHHGI